MRFRSFDSLCVFRAVAEMMSFTAAGERLNMSKGAVSYQIGKLERELGFELFERRHTHIRLTPQGVTLLNEAERYLGKLEDAINDLRASSGNTLCVGAHSWFISRWLGPRLSGFTREHPNVALRIEPINRLQDLRNPDLDLTVFWGVPASFEFEAEVLYSSRTGPIANPEIVSRIDEIGIARAVREIPLLPDASGMEGWREWHRLAGLDFAPRHKPVQLPDANSRLQAVISGHGIALLDELARPEFEAGQVFRVSEVFLQDFAYLLIPGMKQRLSAAASDFRSWLQSQSFP